MVVTRKGGRRKERQAQVQTGGDQGDVDGLINYGVEEPLPWKRKEPAGHRK